MHAITKVFNCESFHIFLRFFHIGFISRYFFSFIKLNCYFWFHVIVVVVIVGDDSNFPTFVTFKEDAVYEPLFYFLPLLLLF